MIQNNLIKKCVCGEQTSFIFDIIYELKIAKCKKCNLIHQCLENFNENDIKDFYEHQYHVDYQQKKGVVTYRDRYNHDRVISKLRLNQYKNFLIPGMNGLDIGSSNSAFVHELIENKINCIGLEPGENIGDKNVTIRGTIESLKLKDQIYDFITMHDSIEHMIDPKNSLIKVFHILKNKGILIIDLPDYFINAGKHHWKYIEHLWFFTQDQFLNLLINIGFKLEKIDKPIPGKLVFYIRKNT